LRRSAPLIRVDLRPHAHRQRGNGYNPRVGLAVAHGAVVTRVRVLNGHFDPLTLAEVVDWAGAWIEEGRQGYLCTVNVAILMMMRHDPRLQRIVDRASLVVADGHPVVWTSGLGNDRLPERVAGVDLIAALAGRSARHVFVIYLIGAPRPVVEAADLCLFDTHLCYL